MTETQSANYLRMAVAAVLGLTAARIAVIALSGLNLYPDEAQYWIWSRTPDFGYYSKPPMLAWVIAATTSVCGQEEFCVRVGSPLIHAATSMVVFVLGRALYDARIGFWAALVHATLPAVFYSATLISTDVPLLFFWALGLWALWRWLETDRLGWALMTGAVVGLGFMSKYAMSFFLLGAGLLILFDGHARARLLSLKGALALLLIAAIFAPNVVWNLWHDFATVSHTADNANWGAGKLFNPGKLAAFLFSQFAVFGPVLFSVLLIWLVTAQRRLSVSPTARQDLYLLCFTLAPMGVVIGQAFISRAHANWAASAYIAAVVLVVAWLLRAGRRGWLRLSLGLHAAAGILLWLIVLAPAAGERALGLDLKPVREMTGWEEAARRIKARMGEAEDAPYTAILTDKRFVHAALTYYMRDVNVPITAWDGNGVPEDHFQMFSPFRARNDGRVLLVSHKSHTPSLIDSFTHVRFVDALVIDVGRGRTRTLRLYELSGLKSADGDNDG